MNDKALAIGELFENFGVPEPAATRCRSQSKWHWSLTAGVVCFVFPGKARRYAPCGSHFSDRPLLRPKGQVDSPSCCI